MYESLKSYSKYWLNKIQSIVSHDIWDRKTPRPESDPRSYLPEQSYLLELEVQQKNAIST